MILLSSLILSHFTFASMPRSRDNVLNLYLGYTTKVQCQGKLQLSAIGNEQLVQLEAFPKELGCGAFLKPRSGAGRTNLILETSAGSIERIVEVRPLGTFPTLSDLAISVRGATK